MNLDDFIEEKEDNTPTKTIRILVWPNITFSKDLTKDSYIQVIKNMITELNKIRDDLYFYLILPKYLECLDFPNTSQHFTEFPTYPPTMRSHFDVEWFRKWASHDLDFDLVFSHLPEHTHQVKNTLYNVTHHTPPVFGYCHWFDFDSITAWQCGCFNQNMLGILEMDRCYINTQAQKDLVLEQAQKTFNTDIVGKLDKILTVQHLGVKRDDIVDSSVVEQPREKIIVFNHRPDTYKNYDHFVTLMRKLREVRQDFSVWVPLLNGQVPEPWFSNEKFGKEGYYKKLQECWVGFSPKQLYGGWSVSTTDGLMNGVPYIMYDAPYYHELNKTADFFETDERALELLNQYLNDGYRRNSAAYEGITHLNSSLIYEDEMEKMSEYITELAGRNSTHKFSDATHKMADFIRTNGTVSKKELFKHMNWGRGIKFTSYRKKLLTHPNIYDNMQQYPEYKWRVLK